jgi:hypothetical protein
VRKEVEAEAMHMVRAVQAGRPDTRVGIQEWVQVSTRVQGLFSGRDRWFWGCGGGGGRRKSIFTTPKRASATATSLWGRARANK